MGDDLFSVPAGRNHDLTTVGPHMVINGRDLGRVVLELLTPSVTNVYVERISISVQFPYTGHRHIVPSFVVVIGPPEIGRTSVSVLYPKEFPRTVQGHEVLGLFLGVLRCHLGGLVGEEIGARFTALTSGSRHSFDWATAVKAKAANSPVISCLFMLLYF